MRKAFYYDNAIPPENWLKLTSLLWNKIYISPFIFSILKLGNFLEETKNEFLTKLYYADNELFDTLSPEVDWKKAKHTLNEEYFDIYRKLTVEFIGEIQNNLSLSNQILELAKEMDYFISILDFTIINLKSYFHN